MNIRLLSFTDAGGRLGDRLCGALRDAGHDCAADCTRTDPGLDVYAWTKTYFHTADALVFLGAAGIAVRAIAPHVYKKTVDPAVLVLDERGQFVIPILSGHIGGANALAREIAGLLGAQCVLTTGTDVNHLFAVDAWATAQGLAIANPARIKDVSAALLAGQTVSYYADTEIAGAPPAGLVCTQDEAQSDICITVRAAAPLAALHLVPRTLVVGLGCRRGIAADAVEAAFAQTLESAGLDMRAVCAAASIDLKAEEPGLLEFCRARGLPFTTYPAAALAALPGTFSASAFVERVTGVDSVCERSAVMAAGGGWLLVRKSAQDGVTVAVAQKNVSYRF